MNKGPYRKIKDAWYYGPVNPLQFPHGLFHLHAFRGRGLTLKLEPVWCMDDKRDWEDGVPIIETLGEVDTRGGQIFACDCGAIAPDDVVDMVTKNARCDRRAAVQHTKASRA